HLQARSPVVDIFDHSDRVRLLDCSIRQYSPSGMKNVDCSFYAVEIDWNEIPSRRERFSCGLVSILRWWRLWSLRSAPLTPDLASVRNDFLLATCDKLALLLNRLCCEPWSWMNSSIARSYSATVPPLRSRCFIQPANAARRVPPAHVRSVLGSRCAIGGVAIGSPLLRRSSPSNART